MTELLEPEILCHYCGQVVCLDASYNHLNCEDVYGFCIQLKIDKLKEDLVKYIFLKNNKKLPQ